MINPAPFVWPIFGSLGPTAGPGHPGNGPGSTNSAGCTKHQPRRRILSPIRGHFLCFWDRPQKYENMNDKFEAPQGLPRLFCEFLIILRGMSLSTWGVRPDKIYRLGAVASLILGRGGGLWKLAGTGSPSSECFGGRFGSLDRASGADFGSVLAGNLARTDQHPAPDRPGRRPGARSQEVPGQNLPKTGHGSPAGTGSTIDQLKLTCNPSAILNVSFFGLDQEVATKWLDTWFPGLNFGASCTIFD
jgi:hypothetical protein